MFTHSVVNARNTKAISGRTSHGAMPENLAQLPKLLWPSTSLIFGIRKKRTPSQP